MTRYEAVCLLAKRRNELGIPQRVIAEATGESVPLVSHWERGRKPIPDRSLRIYAETVGVVLEWPGAS
ncbi:helix-turn-helix transcriptional regulator [Phytomonospora sp. NPDC050363]|uniref:helix-turn-helix domain-containing protein n=1 Tax=Phytomonospora sp. NPDC050363 TaxID=3155642 RepID=UPI003410810C